MDTSTIILAALPLVVIQVILLVYCLIDLIKRDKNTVKGQNKWIWGIVIVVVNILGPIVYLILGRTEES